MAKVKIKDMSVDDLEQLIEQKLLELLGDPDSGLELKKELRKKLEQRLRKPARKNFTPRGIKEICLRSNGQKMQ